MTRRHACTLAAIAAISASTAWGQPTQVVSQCVNGAPAFASTDPKAARDLLQRLLWRHAHADYTNLLKERGALATFDSIRSRGDSLVAIAVRAQREPPPGRDSLPIVRDSLASRLDSARARVARELPRPSAMAIRPGAADRGFDATPLKIFETAVAGRVRLGQNVRVDITDENRVVAVAICATAVTASRFLELMLEPRLTEIANEYQRSVDRWRMFIDNGYSMTLWERLAASCRLSFIGHILNPLAKCDRKEGESLDPPMNQFLFVHPLAGLAPVLKADTLYRNVGIVELYGYMQHVYGDRSMQTYGLSFAASSLPERDGRLGGVLRTPYGIVGAFYRGKERSPLWVVSADVIDWIPALERASQTARAGAFQRFGVGEWLDGQVSKLVAPTPPPPP
jgi:hypothetical protein